LSDGRCKVLVIDDNRDTADSCVALLQIWGHTAVAAYSAAEGVAQCRALDPDVILIDIGLPGRSGFEVAEELEQLCPDARFVAFTGFTRADIVKRSKASFDAHLTKPAPPSELAQVVATECKQSAKSA
jgi:CheY-like chemotaxis protein